MSDKKHYMEIDVTDAMRETVKKTAAMGLPHRYIRTLIINPATNKPINVDMLRKYFPDELDEGRGKFASICIDRMIRFMDDEKDFRAASALFTYYVGKELDKESQKELAEILKNSEASGVNELLIDMVKSYTSQKVKEHDY